MQLSLSASGTPAQVKADITQQVARARKQAPESGAVLYAVRDEVLKDVAGAGPDDAVTVSAELTIKTRIVPATPAEANEEEQEDEQEQDGK